MGWTQRGRARGTLKGASRDRPCSSAAQSPRAQVDDAPIVAVRSLDSLPLQRHRAWVGVVRGSGGTVTSPDPWAPWADVDPDALGAALDHDTFDAQVRALLDLAPKTSAKQIAALPWPEPHAPAEVKQIREAWAYARNAKRDAERERDEKPLDAALWEQMQAAARTGAWKDAKSAFELMTKLQASKIVEHAAPADDFSRLTDVEVLFLGALLHKLRDEPMTEFDEQAIAWIAACTEAT